MCWTRTFRDALHYYALPQRTRIEEKTASIYLQPGWELPFAREPRGDRGSSVLHPTKTFSSKWNCVLDHGANANKGLPLNGDHTVAREALPTIPSASTLLAVSIQPGDDQRVLAVSGNRQHTMDVTTMASKGIPKLPANYRSSTAMLNPASISERDPKQHTPPTGGGGSILPSAVMQQS